MENEINLESIVYRKLHSLSFVVNDKIAKFFNLFEGTYIVVKLLYRNVATTI